MASSKAYLDFILDQLSGLDEISCGASDMKLVPTKHSDAAVRLRGRTMFGENGVRDELQGSRKVVRLFGKRRSSGTNEFSCLHGNERYGACDDASTVITSIGF